MDTQTLLIIVCVGGAISLISYFAYTLLSGNESGRVRNRGKSIVVCLIPAVFIPGSPGFVAVLWGGTRRFFATFPSYND